MLFWSKPVGTFWCCLEQESVTGSKLEKLQKGSYACKRRLAYSALPTTWILPCESLRWMPRNGRIGKHPVCSFKWLLSNSGRKHLCEIFLIVQQGTKEPIAWLQLLHNHDPFASNEFDCTSVMRISVTLRKPWEPKSQKGMVVFVALSPYNVACFPLANDLTFIWSISVLSETLFVFRYLSKTCVFSSANKGKCRNGTTIFDSKITSTLYCIKTSH